ncbi:MAG: hypothetical protein AB7Q97_00695 [Gammaproteobacteria bacterium]
MYKHATKTLGIGRTLDHGTQLFRATFRKAGPFSLLVGVVTIASGELLQPQIERAAGGQFPWLAFAGSIVLVALFGMLFISALVVRQNGIADGADPGPAESLRTAAGRTIAALLCVAAVGLMFGLIVLVAGAILGFVAAAVRSGGSAAPASAPVIAVLVFAIAGTAIVVAYTYASQAYNLVVLHRLGPLRALRRSFTLVSGNFWRTAIVITVAYALTTAFQLLQGAIVLSFVGFEFTEESLKTLQTDLILRWIDHLLTIAVLAVVMPWFTAISLVQLNDLTLRRDGGDLERRLAELDAVR